METVTVAAVQATPEFLDRDATVQKVVRLTKEAAGMGARLIVFPETFIPTYPDWVWRAAAWDGPFEALTARLREQSVEVPVLGDRGAREGREAREGLPVGRRERARRRTRSTTRSCSSVPTARSRGSTGS